MIIKMSRVRPGKKNIYDTHIGRRYRKGDYKVWCPVCGHVGHRSESLLRWDNVLVCKDCFDPKHPQLDPINGPDSEGRGVDIARPRQTDTFKTDQTESDL